jgi:hypothetical protein
MRRYANQLAQTIADVPELVWKIWLLTEQEGEASGIYLFQNDQSLAAFLSSPILAQIKSLPSCPKSARSASTQLRK